MPSVSSTASPSTSGITTDEAGQRHIPSSTRADGSKRKEIKIRPGYRPPEDVEVYKNRTAHAFATRGSGGIPGAEGLEDNDETNKQDGKLSKNAKRREARKKARATDAEEEGQEEEGEPETTKVNGEVEQNNQPVLSKEEEQRIENEKKARKLRKKLREARELQEKKDKGETLLHEQFEKVIKITELIRDLDKLGFGADGEPKESLQDG